MSLREEVAASARRFLAQNRSNFSTICCRRKGDAGPRFGAFDVVESISAEDGAWQLSSLLSDVLAAARELHRKPRSLKAQVDWERAEKAANEKHADIVAALIAGGA